MFGRISKHKHLSGKHTKTLISWTYARYGHDISKICVRIMYVCMYAKFMYVFYYMHMRFSDDSLILTYA